MQMMMLIGRVLTDGRMSARIKYDVTDRFSVKVNAQVSSENFHRAFTFLLGAE